MSEFEKKPALSLEGLLCPNTLRSAFREVQRADLPAREGLKELLNSGATLPQSGNNEAEQLEFSKLERCQDLLVEEFFTRKQELLRLNLARKNLILDFIRSRTKRDFSLEDSIYSKMGSPEHEALQLYAHQVSLFQLLQILLVKRWTDKKLLCLTEAEGKNSTLNWQIISFLKKNSPKGIIHRHDWSFLKANLYSWYSPSKETMERLNLMLDSMQLQSEPGDFLIRFVHHLGSRNRLSLLGMQPNLLSSVLIWKVLLALKNFQEGKEDIFSSPFSSQISGSIFLSGLKNGENLIALRELSENKILQGVWAFTDSDFERFLSEIFLLWESSSEIPQINIHPRSSLKEIGKDVFRSIPLFQNGNRSLSSAQFGGCFQHNGGDELKDIPVLLEQLREGGMLLVSADTYWPTDNNKESEDLRDSILRKASIRFVMDLRQLNGHFSEKCPKAIVLLEKSSSKEARDSNRPQIVKLRGHANPSFIENNWNQILDLLQKELTPGEVFSKNIQSGTDAIKVESMTAAAAQQELRSKPWMTLSDPSFYEASFRLRRHPSKAYTLGTLIRWSSKNGAPSPRGIFLRESEGRLNAFRKGASATELDASHYFFIPEASLPESSDFLRAQILSAPVQFWFRLELEQSVGKRIRKLERISEQRLKLMPLIRIFEAGTLVPVQNATGKGFDSVENLKARLSQIFSHSSLSLKDRQEIHEIVGALENSIQKGIDLCSEYAKFLFPQVTIHRENLPVRLPDVSPGVVLDIFRHLDKLPITQHPSIHITRYKPAHDFKVTNVQYEETATGALGEMKVYQGMDAILKISGPTLLMRAIHEDILKKTGRGWKEFSDRLLLPTDFPLIQTQIREILSTIDSQMKQTREMIRVIDQIFCCLFGLASRFEDDKALCSMKRHLSPEEQQYVLQVQHPQQHQVFTQEDFVAPTEVLQ